MLRALLAPPAIALETMVGGATVLLTSPFTARAHEPTIQAWARTVLWTAGVELSVSGAESLDPSRPYVVISNHQSHMDVPCLVRALPLPVRFVAKRELFLIPIFGPAMRKVGMVSVDRQHAERALAALREAQQTIASRFSLLFFAEGTRSEDGSLGPFKKGGFVMAQNTGNPIVPVAIDGTRERLPKGFHTLRPGPVRVTIGKPIEPGPNTLERRDELMALTRAEIERMLIRLS